MSVKRAILLSVFIELVILFAAFFLFGFTLAALQITTRFSGRFSLLIFSLIFLTQNKIKLSQWLSNQPYTVFAVIHGIHLIELLLFVYFSEIKLVPIRLLGGFIAYLLIFLMPVFTHYRMQNKISIRQYFTIEIIYQYYVWLIFFITYLTRVLGTTTMIDGNYWGHVAFLGWITTMLGTKVVSLINFKVTKP